MLTWNHCISLNLCFASAAERSPRDRTLIQCLTSGQELGLIAERFPRVRNRPRQKASTSKNVALNKAFGWSKWRVEGRNGTCVHFQYYKSKVFGLWNFLQHHIVCCEENKYLSSFFPLFFKKYCILPLHPVCWEELGEKSVRLLSFLCPPNILLWQEKWDMLLQENILGEHFMQAGICSLICTFCKLSV